MPSSSAATPAPEGAEPGGTDSAGTSPEGAATQTCPHCGEPNVVDALFCESCGYDFTTGTPPMGSEPAEKQPLRPEEVDAAVPDEEPPTEAEPAPQLDAEADEPAEEARPDSGSEVAVDSDDDESPVESQVAVAPRPEPKPEPVPEPTPEPAAPAHRQPRHTPPSRALADTWVIELWVDPDWYAVQQTDENCPSPGLPDTVLLTRSTALVGRPSGSRGVRPEVDAGADSAVSRRHAQLTSDGRRWWVEDLGSSNGTFVGTVGQPLPTTPITPGQRVEIDRDDRIYVGAWTRLVLRQATDSERQGTG
jgi:hypothetical protein